MALIQIPELDTGTPRLRQGEEFMDISSRESQRRVSFSSFLARQEELQQLQLDAVASAAAASSSGDQPADFEFVRPKSPCDSAAFPADELFYDGKMLPLEPMSRMAMVKDLNTLSRGGSAPPSPYFSSSGSGKAPSTTQKSSSYPPRGRSSRRFKDFFFVLKKSHSTPISPPPPPPLPSKPASSSSNLLRSIFFGRKEKESSSSSPSTSTTSRVATQGQVGDQHQHHHHHSRIKQQHQQQQQRKNRPIASVFPPSPYLAMDTNFTRSAPATPLHHRASAGGFVPVLHVPACIGPAKVSKFFSGSTNKTVEVFM